MITLNLCPWREKQRKFQAKKFYSALGLCALMSLVFIMGVSLVLHQRTLHETKKINALIKEEQPLQPKLKRVRTLIQQRNDLLTKQQKMIVVQKQNYQRLETLIQIGNQKKAGVTLQKILFEQGAWRIQGTAHSPLQISAYIKNLKESLDLDVTLQDAQQPHFTLLVTPSVTGEKR